MSALQHISLLILQNNMEYRPDLKQPKANTVKALVHLMPNVNMLAKLHFSLLHCKKLAKQAAVKQSRNLHRTLCDGY